MSAMALPWRRAKNPHKIGLRGQTKLLVFKLGYGHIGGLAAIGAYFCVTQLLHGQHTTIGHTDITFPDVKWAWDHLLDQIIPIQTYRQWTTTRHLVRPLYEGIFGGLLVVFIAFNPFKVRKREKPTGFSALEVKLRVIPTYYSKVTGPQMVLLFFTITLYSLPGVALGYGIDQLLHQILHTHSLAPALSHHSSLEQRFYSQAFDAKVIGLFGAAWFARRPAKPVIDFVMRYFAQRRAVSNRKMRFYHPPAFKLLVDDYREQESFSAPEEHGKLIHILVPSLVLGIVVMAGLGYYVIRYIA